MSKIPYTFVPIPQYFWDHGWFKDINCLRYVTWAFSRCSTQKRKVFFLFKEVELEPFEFISGRKTCSEETGLSEMQVRNQQNHYLNAGMLEKVTSKSTNKFTVYRWVTARFKENYNQQNNQQTTSRQPADNHNQEAKKKDIKEDKTTTKESDKEKIVRFGSPSFDDDRLEGYCLYAEHHELQIQESDFKKWLKHPDDRINSNLSKLIDKKDKVKNHAAWMQAAIDRDYAGIENLIEKNLKFTEDFKKKNKWHNLTITKQYCRNEKTGNDFQYHLPEFRQMLENEFKKEKENYG